MAAPVLPRSTPTAEGVDPAAITAFVEAAEAGGHGLHSLMVVRHGSVVAEGWWHPYAPDVRHLAQSVSKSFLSTAIGIAQGEGVLSVDDPIAEVLGIDGPADLRLRHLLTMSSGHDVDTMTLMRQLPGEDWVRLFFAAPFVYPPGEHFLYNGGCSYLLSAALTARTGMTVRDYLEPRLFQPLGLATPPWSTSPAGLSLGSSGTSLLTEDIAVLAELYRRGGDWGGVQLVPADWVEEATRAHIDTGPNASEDWALGYGYQFWRSRHGFRMDGAFGQYGLVIPERDLVVAITAGSDDGGAILQLVWDHLLPGVDRAPGGTDDAVAARLAGLDLAGPVFLAEAPPAADDLAGRPIALPFTTLGLSTATLTLDGDRTELETVGTDGTVERLAAGRTEWLPGQTAIWPHPDLAGWTDATTFEVHEQLIESACRRVWRFELLPDDDVRLTVGLDLPFWTNRVERVTGRLGFRD
jgi:CubicO group peptidase (beta-lactamase class C family)